MQILVNSCSHRSGICWTSSDNSLTLSAMLLEGDIAGASSDMMLAVLLELLSESVSVDKTLSWIKGWGQVVGIELVVDLLGSSPGLVVPAELVFFIPALGVWADIAEPVPMLPLPVVLIIFSW